MRSLLVALAFVVTSSPTAYADTILDKFVGDGLAQASESSVFSDEPAWIRPQEGPYCVGADSITDEAWEETRPMQGAPGGGASPGYYIYRCMTCVQGGKTYADCQQIGWYLYPA